MTNETHAIDYNDITERQQKTWAAGDFTQIARLNVVMAEALCEAVDPHPGQRVLDVACGNGSAALAAARRCCEVTGIDYVPELIERAEMRANGEGLAATFRVEDAQDLPFPDDHFDAVLSVFGVQFAPDQEQAANELLRVCRPGGTIGLVGPTHGVLSGDVFAVVGEFAPPPPGVKPPLRWGTDDGLEELLGAGTRSLESDTQPALAYFRSIDHAWEVFSTYFGPIIRTLETLDEDERAAFRDDFKTAFEEYNRATDGTAIVENRYHQTIAIRA